MEATEDKTLFKATNTDNLRTLFPEFRFYKSWQRNYVKDHVDDKQRHREDETYSKVEPSVEENWEFYAVETILFLQVVGAVHVSGKEEMAISYFLSF